MLADLTEPKDLWQPEALTLRNISTQLVVCRALQAVELISPGTISPKFPALPPSGSVLAMIIWYFISQEVSFPAAVFPSEAHKGILRV